VGHDDGGIGLDGQPVPDSAENGNGGEKAARRRSKPRNSLSGVPTPPKVSSSQNLVKMMSSMHTSTMDATRARLAWDKAPNCVLVVKKHRDDMVTGYFLELVQHILST